MELDITVLCGFMNDINNLAFLNAGVSYAQWYQRVSTGQRVVLACKDVKQKGSIGLPCLDSLPEQMVLMLPH